MKPELLPCPFCGGEAKIFEINDGENAGGSCVCCTKCLASGNVEFGRKENFVSRWNTRAAPATDEALVEVVTKAILFEDCGNTEDWEENTHLGNAAIAAMQAHITARESFNTKVMELPMTAFADQHPVRDELMGEQTILIHTAAATWDLRFFETSESFPERWFGEHWIDITEMWPGVTAQVTEFHKINEQAIRNKALDEAAAWLKAHEWSGASEEPYDDAVNAILALKEQP